MKHTATHIVLSLLFILVYACASHPKKIAYIFPSEMNATVKADYTRYCDKGRALYELNCAGCHNNRKGYKKGIPDFTVEQLESYQIRGRKAHETRLEDDQVNAEELSYIIMFLTYKERSHIPSGNSTAIPH